MYQVSNLGRVKSLGNSQKRQEKLLKFNIVHGYNTVYLSKIGKRTATRVHRLVAQAFIPNPDNLPQVNHKDKNRLNNRVDDLEWCTQQYNVRYSLAKPVLCVETGVVYNSMTEASEVYNIELALLSRVCGKPNYRAGGYHWRFL